MLLITLAIAGIIYLPLPIFNTIATILMLIATWEWSTLLPNKSYLTRCIYLVIMAVLMRICWYIPIKPILFVSLIWWLIALFLILTYPKTTWLWAKNTYTQATIGILTLIPSWLSLITIRSAPKGALTLIFIFCIIWGADSGAYFAGKWWGKHKLIPLVSPKKTWQGVYGGLLLTIIVAVIGCIVFNMPFTHWPFIIVLVIATVIFSIIGDLLESMLKRQANLKDTGNYLPGHGGLLDRIDSLTAAMPIFLLGSLLFNLIPH